MIAEVFESGEFSGKKEEYIVIHRFPGFAAERLVLAGLGNDKDVDGESYRVASGLISTQPSIRKSAKVGFYFDLEENLEYSQAVVEGFNLGRFKMLDYKSSPDCNDGVENLIVAVSDRRKLMKAQKALDRGEIIAESANLARVLTSHPGNYLTPRKFSSEVEKLGKKYGFSTRILDDKEIRKEKMGALLAVSQGSKQPPRFAIMKYNGGKAKSKPIVLVGKGVTFDAGGISLKQPLNMGEMKGDMQGAAIVVGTMTAAARLGIKQNLVGLVPMTENLPSGTAIKPGDIVTSRKGKTIEIINTDAEGRLILADGLDYANEFDPAAVFDIATLTGAAKYILGTGGIPIMGNSEKAIELLYESSARCGERVWELPMWETYARMMESPIADLKNSAGAEAGTLTAGSFLKQFIGDWPWTHIDIAAVDVEKKGKPYIPVGVTGIGLRLLVDMLMHWRKV